MASLRFFTAIAFASLRTSLPSCGRRSSPPAPLCAVAQHSESWKTSGPYVKKGQSGAHSQACGGQAELLIEAGCTYISVDEPVFVRYPAKVEVWGIRMLDKLLEGLQCYKAVHICCSYPTCPQKADCRLYQNIAEQLAASALDAVSIEYANKEFDLKEVLVPLEQAKKSVILGVIRVHEDVESVELIKERAHKALQYIHPSRLLLGPDCGLVCISREASLAKMKNMTQAAAELNKELNIEDIQACNVNAFPRPYAELHQ